MNCKEENLKDILHKTSKVLDEMEYSSVPPIIYNSILLGQGKCPGKVLEMILNYFNKREKKRIDQEKTAIRTDSMATDEDVDSISIVDSGKLFENLMTKQN